MTWLRRRKTPVPPRPRAERPHEKPDVARAQRQLERIRRQRPEVEELVSALAEERRLNNFTASAVIVFRGGRS